MDPSSCADRNTMEPQTALSWVMSGSANWMREEPLLAGRSSAEASVVVLTIVALSGRCAIPTLLVAAFVVKTGGLSQSRPVSC